MAFRLPEGPSQDTSHTSITIFRTAHHMNTFVHRLYKAYKIDKKSVKPAARTLNKHDNDTAVCYSRHFRNRMHILIKIRSTRQSKQISSNKTYGAMLTQLPQIEATS